MLRARAARALCARRMLAPDAVAELGGGNCEQREPNCGPNATGKARVKRSGSDSTRSAGIEERPSQMAAMAGLKMVKAALVMRGTAHRNPPLARFMQSTALGSGGMDTARPSTMPVMAKFIGSTYGKACPA